MFGLSKEAKQYKKDSELRKCQRAAIECFASIGDTIEYLNVPMRVIGYHEFNYRLSYGSFWAPTLNVEWMDDVKKYHQLHIPYERLEYCKKTTIKL